MAGRGAGGAGPGAVRAGPVRPELAGGRRGRIGDRRRHRVFPHRPCRAGGRPDDSGGAGRTGRADALGRGRERDRAGGVHTCRAGLSRVPRPAASDRGRDAASAAPCRGVGPVAGAGGGLFLGLGERLFAQSGDPRAGPDRCHRKHAALGAARPDRPGAGPARAAAAGGGVVDGSGRYPERLQRRGDRVRRSGRVGGVPVLGCGAGRRGRIRAVGPAARTGRERLGDARRMAGGIDGGVPRQCGDAAQPAAVGARAGTALPDRTRVGNHRRRDL